MHCSCQIRTASLLLRCCTHGVHLNILLPGSSGDWSDTPEIPGWYTVSKDFLILPCCIQNVWPAFLPSDLPRSVSPDIQSPLPVFPATKNFPWLHALSGLWNLLPKSQKSGEAEHKYSCFASGFLKSILFQLFYPKINYQFIESKAVKLCLKITYFHSKNYIHL